MSSRTRQTKSKPQPLPVAMRWWPTLGCVLGAIFISILAAPLVGVVVNQAQLMVPAFDTQATSQDYTRAVQQALADRAMMAVRHACRQMATQPDKPLPMSRYRQLDPDNALYDYLLLDQQLRGTIDDQTVVDQLRSLSNGPPCRLHINRELEILTKSFRDAGFSERRSVWHGRQTHTGAPSLQRHYRPLIRGLIGRLDRLATRWRDRGQSEQACLARRAAVGLLTDMVLDSPDSAVALLALESMPTLLTELAQDEAALAHSPRQISFREQTINPVSALEQQSQRLKQFQHDYRELFAQELGNILPQSALLKVIPELQDRALISIGANSYLLLVWALLLALCIVLLIATILSRTKPDDFFYWAANGRGKWWAALIFLGAHIVLIAIYWTTISDYSWVYSLPSVPGLVGSLGISLFVLTCLHRFFARYPDQQESTRIPLRWAGGIVVAMALLTLLIVWATIGGHHPGQPPMGILFLRKLGIVAGLLGLLGAIIFLTWNRFGQRGCGGSLPLALRSGLQLASACWLLISALVLAGLVVNHRLDRTHREQFPAAFVDPLANRLDRDWLETCFGSTRTLLNRIERTQERKP